MIINFSVVNNGTPEANFSILVFENFYFFSFLVRSLFYNVRIHGNYQRNSLQIY